MGIFKCWDSSNRASGEREPQHAPLSRVAAKKSGLKILCPVHKTLERVVDYFPSGELAVLSCGARRRV
jgi:hypothetical protein